MSKQLLHLDSSILGAVSATRALSARLVDTLRAKYTRMDVTYRDLAAEPIPHLSGAYLMAAAGDAGAPSDPALAADLRLGGTLLQEFMDAEFVVIGVPFYNFSIPSQLKAWIDRIAVAGKTFRYSESGKPQGLAGDKRVFLAVSRGGFYGGDSPVKAMEHAESYLRAAFAFIGITDLHVIAAEGMRVNDAQRNLALADAHAHIDRTVAALPA